MNDKKKFEQFVNSIKKEKLSGFVDGEKSEIAVDYKLGYRLDHQGVSSPIRFPTFYILCMVW